MSLLALASAGLLGCQPAGGASPCPEGASACSLVITEVFADPEGANDGGQWIEIYNPSAEIIDLRGLRLFFEYTIGDNPQQKRHTIVADEPVLLEPGRYAALTDGELMEGDLWSYGEALPDMSGSGVRVSLVCDDGTEIDAVCIGRPCEDGDPEFTFIEGMSVARASVATGGGASGDCTAADSGAGWSVAAPTRNAANPTTTLVACCHDPGSEAVPSPPTPGSLVITEVYANPEGADGDAEWLEFYVDLPEGTWVDMTGVRFTDDAEEAGGGHRFSPFAGCTLLEGGSYGVVAGNLATTQDESATCFGVGDGTVLQSMEGLTLKNSEGVVAIWSAEGELLGEFAYGEAYEGSATQFEAESGTWCASTKPYTEASDHFGSPGEANPACGAAWCWADGELVEAQQPSTGELVITEILADVPGNETDGPDYEWFEARLLPSLDGPRDLAGLTVHKKVDDAGKALLPESGDCLRTSPGDYVLFAMSADESVNGGLPAVDTTYEKLSSGLTNDNGYLALRRTDGALVDEVPDYGKSDDGVARQLDPDVVDTLKPAESNDDVEAWCDAVEPYGDVGGVGTPGEANTTCESEE